MFQRLYELSTILPQNLETWEKLNEGMPPEYNRGFALCFDEQGNWISVQIIRKTGKEVIYRSGPSNGTDFTPCCKLSTSTSERILRAIEALENNFTGSEVDHHWLKTTIEIYKQNQSTIWNELEKIKTAENLDPKVSRGFVLWAKLLENGRIDYVYTWEAAKKFLEQQFFESLAKKGGKRSSGVCMITGKTDQEVYGGFSDIACYNLDKPGSIAGGFSEKLAHHNFPVSKDAAVDIARAFTYAKDHLQGTMAGETYLILPYAANPDIREQLHDRLSHYPERFQLGKVKDLVAEESELIDEFGNLGDQIAFFLVFYEENQASWRIQAEIQELLPSRLRQLQEARKKIEKSPDLIYEKEGEEKRFNVSANTFKHFTSGTKEQSANTLRVWLVALFEGRTIDHRHFLHHLVDKIVATGKKNSEYLYHTTREALGLYRYALLVGMITIEEETTMDLPDFNSVYGCYVREHGNFFTKPEIVTAFLLGCYVSTVTNVQYHERKATPFTRKFIGRLLNKDMLKRLYREAHDKLMQYNSLGIVAKGLDPDLTQSWVACGQNWKISNEETTFAFTIGYSLQYRISQLYKDSSPDTTETEE